MTMLILRHSIDHNDYNDHDGSAIDKNLRIMTAILERACLWYFVGEDVAMLAMIRFLVTGIPLYFEPSNKEFQSDGQRVSGNAEHFGS